MAQSRDEIVAWVGGQVLPHEADVRAWLRRRLAGEAAVDDVVQEAYCRIAALSGVGHISSGRAYFFRTVSNILIEQLRRARIVRIDTVAEFEPLNVVADEPSPERIVSGRRDLERVRGLIEGLPQRCREVFELRRIHGLSQKDVASRLGVTENVVEAQSMRGLKLILKALEGGEHEHAVLPTKRHEPRRNSARDR